LHDPRETPAESGAAFERAAHASRVRLLQETDIFQRAKVLGDAGRLTSWGSANSPRAFAFGEALDDARRIGWARAANTSSSRTF